MVKGYGKRLKTQGIFNAQTISGGQVGRRIVFRKDRPLCRIFVTFL